MPELRDDYFSYLVDISPSWQGSFVDDGVYEGFPLDGVIQKAAQGLTDYTRLGSFNNEKWQKQYDSIRHFDILMSYHYFKTDQSGKAQAQLFMDILDRNEYVGGAVDFEGVGNLIDAAAVWKLLEYVKEFKANSTKKLLVYTNGSTYNFIRDVLRLEAGEATATAWMNKQIWWIAGGMIYNQKLYALPTNEYDPFPRIPWTFLQFSADRNELADEVDFSEHEAEDIDYNRVRMSPSELYTFFNVTLPDDDLPPPDDSPPDLETRVQRLEAELRNHESRIRRLERLIVSSGGTSSGGSTDGGTPPPPVPRSGTVAARVTSTNARYHYQEGNKLRLSTQRDPKIREVRGARVAVKPNGRRWQRREGGTALFHEVPSAGGWLKANDIELG